MNDYSDELIKSKSLIFKIGGIVSITTVVLSILEIMITFLPNGNASAETVIDWFIFYMKAPLLLSVI